MYISGTVHSLKKNPNNDKVLIVGTMTQIKKQLENFFAIDFEYLDQNEEGLLKHIRE